MSPAPAAADIAGSLLGGATGLYRAIVEACEDGIIAGTGFVDPSGSLGPNGSWRLLVAEGDAVSAGQPLIELIGEAAHAFPPIGAQGLNLGLRDVADVARALAAVDRSRPDWASG